MYIGAYSKAHFSTSVFNAGTLIPPVTGNRQKSLEEYMTNILKSAEKENGT